MKTLIAVFALLITTEIAPPAPWQNPDAWKRVRPGFASEQVSRILGDPAHTESSSTLEVWYYQDVPVDGHRPSAGRLIFRKTPSGMQLKEFDQPDWSRVPDWQQLNLDYRNQLVVERQAAAAKPLPPPAAPQPRPVEPIVVYPAPQTPPQAYTPPVTEDVKTQRLSRYFIWCGGAIFAIGLVIAICQGSRLFPRG